MTIFYEHIGEKLWGRDGPKSIGSNQGVLRFKFEDIEEYLDELPAYEIAVIRAKIDELAPSGFQIWGIPEGARIVVNRMESGDFLLLLESVDFRYVGTSDFSAALGFVSAYLGRTKVSYHSNTSGRNDKLRMEIFCKSLLL